MAAIMPEDWIIKVAKTDGEIKALKEKITGLEKERAGAIQHIQNQCKHFTLAECVVTHGVGYLRLCMTCGLTEQSERNTNFQVLKRNPIRHVPLQSDLDPLRPF